MISAIKFVLQIHSQSLYIQKQVIQTYFGFGGDPIDKTQDWHSNEDPKRHQQFPSSPTPPPTRQVTAPNGGEHLLTDGMSHKLEEQMQTVTVVSRPAVNHLATP